MNPSLRQLRYFEAVAQLRSFSSAAERLFVTQPSLSRQVQLLEDAIGARLLRRTTRSVELTDAGRVLHERLGPTLEQLSRALDAAQRAGRGETPALRLGFVGSAIHGSLSTVIARFGAAHPQVELMLTEGSAHDQLRMLLHDEIDAGLCRVPPVHDRLSVLQVESVPMLLAVPASMTVRTGKFADISRLGSSTWLQFRRELAPALHDEIVGHWRAAGIAPRVIYAETMQAMLGLVAAGAGVAMILGTMRSLRLDGVRWLSLGPNAPRAPLFLVWRRGDANHNVAAVRRLFKSCQ